MAPVDDFYFLFSMLRRLVTYLTFKMIKNLQKGMSSAPNRNKTGGIFDTR